LRHASTPAGPGRGLAPHPPRPRLGATRCRWPLGPQAPPRHEEGMRLRATTAKGWMMPGSTPATSHGSRSWSRGVRAAVTIHIQRPASASRVSDRSTRPGRGLLARRTTSAGVPSHRDPEAVAVDAEGPVYKRTQGGTYFCGGSRQLASLAPLRTSTTRWSSAGAPGGHRPVSSSPRHPGDLQERQCRRTPEGASTPELGRLQSKHQGQRDCGGAQRRHVETAAAGPLVERMAITALRCRLSPMATMVGDHRRIEQMFATRKDFFRKILGLGQLAKRKRCLVTPVA